MKGSKTIFGRIFNSNKNVNCIFYLLHTDFTQWLSFCHCVGAEFISQNKRVHRIFIEKLEKKTERIQQMDQLQNLALLLREFPILNRLQIRMKLLRTVSLLDTEQWRDVVTLIMQIVWQHARIDEDNSAMLQHCTAELLFNLLKRDQQRQFALKLFVSATCSRSKSVQPIQGDDELSTNQEVQYNQYNDSDDGKLIDFFLITDSTKMEEEEDDLYAYSSSEDEAESNIPNLPMMALDVNQSNVNDDDTNLAIALSQSTNDMATNQKEEKEND